MGDGFKQRHSSTSSACISKGFGCSDRDGYAGSIELQPSSRTYTIDKPAHQCTFEAQRPPDRQVWTARESCLSSQAPPYSKICMNMEQ